MPQRRLATTETGEKKQGGASGWRNKTKAAHALDGYESEFIDVIQ